MLVVADNERVVLRQFLQERNDDFPLVLGLARERIVAEVGAGANLVFAADAGRPEHQHVRAAEYRLPRMFSA